MSDHSDRMVAVIGLGAIGSMTLLSLARRGIPAIGFEQSSPGDDMGAYGGYSRQFRLASHDSHGRQHITLAGESLDLWRELEQVTGETLYIRAGQLGVGTADDPDITALLRCLQTEGLDHQVLASADLMRRFPQHLLAHDEIGVYSVEAGVLRSNRAVRAAVEEAQRLGAVVYPNGRVQSIEPFPGGVRVIVNGEQRTVDHAVVTTGPWVGELIPGMRAAVTVRRIVNTWFEPATGESFDSATFPPGFRRSRSGNSYTFLPGVDGTAAKFIFWIPMRPVIDNPSNWDRNGDSETVESTRRALLSTMRGVAQTPRAVRSYMEGFTPDRWPVVGRVSNEITVLTGFSGSGFAIAPVMGEIAADLAADGVTRRDIANMSPRRFDLMNI